MEAFENTGHKLKVAVIEGYHPFEVPQWRCLWDSFAELDVYLQTIDNWAFDCAHCRKDYDAVVFYNMNMEMNSPFNDQLQAAIEEIGTAQQGIVFLHHAILAYPKDPRWSKAVGIPNRQFDFYGDQKYMAHIADADHPITQGISDFTICDETYTMDSAGSDSRILITADHQKSMKTIGWTRTYKGSRVFCFQCGHDHLAWQNDSFKMILLNGIKWASHAI